MLHQTLQANSLLILERARKIMAPNEVFVCLTAVNSFRIWTFPLNGARVFSHRAMRSRRCVKRGRFSAVEDFYRGRICKLHQNKSGYRRC